MVTKPKPRPISPQAAERLARDSERYKEAAQRAADALAALAQFDAAQFSPVHLRIGVNTAFADSASLAALLINKGVITAEEFIATLAEGMECEAKNYEDDLRDQMKRVTERDRAQDG